MGHLRRSTAGRALAALLLLALPFQSAVALVITSNHLTISGITITPASGTAFIEPWTAEASASANNSLGQSAGEFDSSASAAMANAAIIFATATGAADALVLTGSGDTAVNLPGDLNQAAATGQGNLFTFFTIAGGIGSVDVTFAMHLDGTQHAFTDSIGRVRSELVATLELDGNVVLFRNDILEGGPAFPDTTKAFVDTLTSTQTLFFDTPYFVFIQADAESSGINLREPPGFALLLAAVGLLVFCTTRRVAAQQQR
jgi:hypothetical protein